MQEGVRNNNLALKTNAYTSLVKKVIQGARIVPAVRIGLKHGILEK